MKYTNMKQTLVSPIDSSLGTVCEMCENILLTDISCLSLLINFYVLRFKL